MNPRITVVTVSYNCCNEIEKTILSVINQTYKAIEYLIVDGNSTDGTVELIKKYDSQITKWISEPDGGIYYAMNKGIDMATGEWLIFMNAGDTFADDNVLQNVFYNKQYNADIRMLLGDTIVSFPFGNYLKEGYTTEGKYNFCHQSLFTRVEDLKNWHYDTSYRIIADNVYLSEGKKRGDKLQYVPLAISVYEGYNGLSANGAIGFYKDITLYNGTKRDLKWHLSLLKLKLKIWIQTMLPMTYKVKKLKSEIERTHKHIL